MTVKELKEKLNNYDENLDIEICEEFASSGYKISHRYYIQTIVLDKEENVVSIKI